MYVPNYIPPPLEVPDNVTGEKHSVRLGFVRRVALLHFGSLLLIGGMSLLPLPLVPLTASIGELAILLVALSFVRIGTRATRLDLRLSSSLLPVVLILSALVVKKLDAEGWPVWGIAVGAGCSVIYAFCSKRDFSFVGEFLLSLIASSFLLAVVATMLRMNTHQAAFLLGANMLYLFYLVYDSASLLARRRLGEEFAAVVDLYRDVFNVFGYLMRVARHWRKHRIWAR